MLPIPTKADPLVREDYKKKIIPLDKKWISSVDGSSIGPNFKQMVNLYYSVGGLYPRGVPGMRKVNLTPLSYPHVKGSIFFRKAQPPEQHLLADVWDGLIGSHKIVENTADVPGRGDFSETDVHALTGASPARFCLAPDETVVWCDGVDNYIWGGREGRCGGFINYDPAYPAAGSFYKDYTVEIANTLNDPENRATLKRVLVGGVFETHVYVRTTRVPKAVSFYVGTVNTATADVTVEYWNGSVFAACSAVVDGTIAETGKTLSRAGKGTISFTAPLAGAKLKFLDNIVSYVTHFIFRGIIDGVTVYHCTTESPPQPITDIWNGIDTPVTAFYTHVGKAYHDYTLNVLQATYYENDATSYCNLNNFGINHGGDGTAFLIAGFTRQCQAITFLFPGERGNLTARTMTIYRSNDGINWESVGTLDDGTNDGTGVPFAQPGTVSFLPVAETNEFQSKVSRNTPLWHYKIYFDGPLSGDVRLFYVAGAPVPSRLGKYKFGAAAQDRLLLCCDTVGKKYEMRHTAYQTNCFFNGDDSSTVAFGESGELNCAADLYNFLGNNLTNLIGFWKFDEFWTLSGEYPSWTKHLISDSIGCDAHQTLDRANLPDHVPTGMSRNVWIWKGANGVYISDGKAPFPIHDDIKNYFDPARPEYINPDYSYLSIGKIDATKMWYRLLVPSGSDATGLNTELVFDLSLFRWYRVDRKAKQLVNLTNVTSSRGVTYQYGATDDGYFQRLNFGTDFDGVPIEHTLELSDDAIEQQAGIPLVTKVSAVALTMVGHENNTNMVEYTHSADTVAVESTMEISPVVDDGARLITELFKFGEDARGGIHSGRFVVTTDNEKCGFEPLSIAIYYSDEWENKGG